MTMVLVTCSICNKPAGFADADVFNLCQVTHTSCISKQNQRQIDRAKRLVDPAASSYTDPERER